VRQYRRHWRGGRGAKGWGRVARRTCASPSCDGRSRVVRRRCQRSLRAHLAISRWMVSVRCARSEFRLSWSCQRCRSYVWARPPRVSPESAEAMSMGRTDRCMSSGNRAPHRRRRSTQTSLDVRGRLHRSPP
jgi:hypothetical protein